jgi:hypothetical protein
MMCYIDLLGPYLQYVISTFNTYSRVTTHRSLINTDGGYKLEGASFPQHSPRSSQQMVLRFFLIAPSGLRLTILNINLQQ